MKEKYTIAVFYYTQTGQALSIAQNVCEPLTQAGCKVVYKEIAPVQPYPFPWTNKSFMQVFPESRLGVPCPLKPIDLSDVEDADLVILAGQSWYLSLSVPLHAFYQSKEIITYLKGRKILTISGCRNMWVMTQLKTREYIHRAGADLVGTIILQDMAPNLISVITIVRWLFYNKKEASRFLPAAGVSEKDLKQATRFGYPILEALETGSFHLLQEKLMNEKAITFIPTVYFIEKKGFWMWGKWAKFILKKGSYASTKREPYLWLFEYYLFFVLYFVSPFGLIFFYLTYPFRLASFKKAQQEMCYELGWNDDQTIQ